MTTMPQMPGTKEHPCERFRLRDGEIQFLDCYGYWHTIKKESDKDIIEDACNAARCWWMDEYTMLFAGDDGNTFMFGRDAADAWKRFGEENEK